MSVVSGKNVVTRGVVLLGLFVIMGAQQIRAQADATTPAGQDSVLNAPVQGARALGEAASEFGGTMRSGGQQAVRQGSTIWSDVMRPALQRISAAMPGVLKAVVLLLAFWLVGNLAGACVRKLLDLIHVNERAVRDWGLESLLKQRDGQVHSLSKLMGTAVKWFFILFGFVAFFNALNLSMVASPLQKILDRIIGAVPGLIKAAAILLLYWVIAALVRAAVIRLLDAIKFDQRFGKHLAKAEGHAATARPTSLIGRLLFYVILLFGVPPFLQALGQQALVYPLQEMLAKVLAFLPNLFAAAIILVVGRIVATIVREVTCNFLAASGADAAAEKLGIGKMLGSAKLSDIVSKIAYFFILIPILVQAVDSLAIKAISEPIKATLQNILSAIPAMMVALVIVVIGCLVARIVRSLLENFLSGIGFDALPKRIGLDWLESKEGRMPPSSLAGAAVGIIIILVTAQQATASLGFHQLAELTRRVVEYLPNLVAAVVIMIAALSLGKHLGTLVSRSLGNHANVALLSAIARYSVIVLGVSMTLEQLGVGQDIITITLSALLGGCALALGLAFGLAGQERAREWIKNWGKTRE